MREGAVETALAPLKSCLHQDVFVVHGSMENCINTFVRSIKGAEKGQLQKALDRVLATKTNAELKGIVRRIGCEITMDSKKARQMLESVQSALAAKG